MQLSEIKTYLVLADRREVYCQPGLNYANADREMKAYLRREGYDKAIFLDGTDGRYTLKTYEESSYSVVSPALKSWGKKAPAFRPARGGDVQTLEKESAEKVLRCALSSDRKTALVAELGTFTELCGVALPALKGQGALVLRSEDSVAEIRRQLLGSGALRQLWPGLDTMAPTDIFSALRREPNTVLLNRSELSEKELRNMLASAALRRDGDIGSEESRKDLAALLYYSYYSESLAEKTALRFRGRTPRRELKEKLEQQRFVELLERCARSFRQEEPVGSLSDRLRREYPVVSECELREENRITALLTDPELRSRIPAEKLGSLDILEEFYAKAWNRILSPETEKHLSDAFGFLKTMYERGEREAADKLLEDVVNHAGDPGLLDRLDRLANALSLYAQASYELANHEETLRRLTESLEKSREQLDACEKHIDVMGSNNTVVLQWSRYNESVTVKEAQLAQLNAERQVLSDTRDKLADGLYHYHFSSFNFSRQQLDSFRTDMEQLAQLTEQEQLSSLELSAPKGERNAANELLQAQEAYHRAHPETAAKNVARMKRLL